MRASPQVEDEVLRVTREHPEWSRYRVAEEVGIGSTAVHGIWRRRNLTTLEKRVAAAPPADRNACIKRLREEVLQRGYSPEQAIALDTRIGRAIAPWPAGRARLSREEARTMEKRRALDRQAPPGGAISP